MFTLTLLFRVRTREKYKSFTQPVGLKKLLLNFLSLGCSSLWPGSISTTKDKLLTFTSVRKNRRKNFTFFVAPWKVACDTNASGRGKNYNWWKAMGESKSESKGWYEHKRKMSYLWHLLASSNVNPCSISSLIKQRQSVFKELLWTAIYFSNANCPVVKDVHEKCLLNGFTIIRMAQHQPWVVSGVTMWWIKSIYILWLIHSCKVLSTIP